jgi:hypothetical protein
VTKGAKQVTPLGGRLTIDSLNGSGRLLLL